MHYASVWARFVTRCSCPAIFYYTLSVWACPLRESRNRQKIRFEISDSAIHITRDFFFTEIPTLEIIGKKSWLQFYCHNNETMIVPLWFFIRTNICIFFFSEWFWCLVHTPIKSGRIPATHSYVLSSEGANYFRTCKKNPKHLLMQRASHSCHARSRDSRDKRGTNSFSTLSS